MASKVLNRSFSQAKKAREDEFYTQLPDIERELRHYKKHFKGKVVYCNCDDPRVSNFFHYFSYNFEKLGLKKLITTCYRSQQRDLFSQNDSETAIYLEYDGDKDGSAVPEPDEIGVKPLKGDGDFRSEESIELLKQADIVATNPPFSMFREYVMQLMQHDKKFLILGNKNAVTFSEIFPLIQNNKIWIGHTPMGTEMVFDVTEEFGKQLLASGRDRKFTVVDGVVKARAPACWFTNLDFAKRHEDIILYKTLATGDYPAFDNYDAVNVDRVEEIPSDYDGVMGVPITFLNKHNPDQFEIVDANAIRRTETVPRKPHGLIKDKDGSIGGKPKYVRIAIRRVG